MPGRLLIFFAGMFSGLFALAVVIWLGAKHLATWIVVTGEPERAEVLVVLGGGDGSRLRKGLQLHEQGFASHLVLVDSRKEDWLHITRSLCKDCILEGKDVTIIEGSTSTRTDAELTLRHCRGNGWTSVLVVTSPYHSRRAQIVFNDVFGGSDIKISVISTDDYGRLRRPLEDWWRDEHTLQTVWVEFGKIVYWKLIPGHWPVTG